MTKIWIFHPQILVIKDNIYAWNINYGTINSPYMVKHWNHRLYGHSFAIHAKHAGFAPLGIKVKDHASVASPDSLTSNPETCYTPTYNTGATTGMHQCASRVPQSKVAWSTNSQQLEILNHKMGQSMSTKLYDHDSHSIQESITLWYAMLTTMTYKYTINQDACIVYIDHLLG